jgi:hypothetical protein
MDKIHIIFITFIVSIFVLAGCIMPKMPWEGQTTGVGTANLTTILPLGISSINFSCFQSNMNNTQPNGQNTKTPILNVTNTGNTNATSITLSINTTLPSGFYLYGCSANYRNPSCPLLNSSAQTVLRSGLLINASKGIWMFGECIGVSDNTTTALNFSVAGVT